MKYLSINNIPTIIWGEKAEKVYIHVHGKMSCKEYAKNFATIASKRGYQMISFDLPEHGQRKEEHYPCTILNAIHDLNKIADYAFENWQHVSLYGCSIGAYFSLHAYANRNFIHCLFQSPILDMAHLMDKMFVWFDISEERLFNEKEIITPIETMSFAYYQYAKKHSISDWRIPTSILYGGKDTLQDSEVIHTFVNKNHCKLDISTSSEHPFMDVKDNEIVNAWLKKHII